MTSQEEQRKAGPSTAHAMRAPLRMTAKSKRFGRGKREMKKQLTFGVIVGSRGFFPHHLAKEGREAIIKVLDANGYKAVVLSPEQTQHGAVQTPDDARHCTELFKKHGEEIDGIIITLPNFGEERT